MGSEKAQTERATEQRFDDDRSKLGLRMNQLVQQSGLAKSTILLYVNQGLLPPPVKTSPNMAYYAFECVERLKQIKSLQQRYRMPLNKIKKILDAKDQGKPVEPMLELLGEIFGAGQGNIMEQDEFCLAAGLTVEQLQALQEARVIIPVESGKYDEQDLMIGQIVAGGLAAGIDPKDMSYYAELGDQIVDHEMRVRAKYTDHLPEEQNAQFTLRMLQAARALRTYVMDRLFLLRVAQAGSLKDKGLQR